MTNPTTQALQALFTGALAPSLYRLVSPMPTGRLLTRAAIWGWQGVHLDGTMITDKQTFLSQAGAALRFPAYYGQNWDAFEEMINDLSWLPAAGYLIVYSQVHRFAAAQPSAWATARDILQSAVDNWHAEGIPFAVLLRQTGWTNLDLPRLDALYGSLDGKGNRP